MISTFNDRGIFSYVPIRLCKLKCFYYLILVFLKVTKMDYKNTFTNYLLMMIKKPNCRAMSLSINFIVLLIFVFAGLIQQINAQANVILKPRVSSVFTFSPGEQKEFTLRLKSDDFIDLTWLASDDLNLEFAFFAPSGKDLLEDVIISDSIPLVVPESGDYVLSVKLGENHQYEDKPITGAQRITFQYTDTWKLPPKSVVKSVRKINGYDIKIVESKPAEFTNYSFLLIEKIGKLKKILKADSTIGFFFSDDMAHTYSAPEKKSAGLMKTTLDKTGDGTPDVAVDYFSGGAHCCYSLYFFELGTEINQVKTLSTADVRTIAIGKNPKGGLRLETADAAFRYWNIGFAYSPMPSVILDFQKGEFRPNFEAMKKTAPPLNKLQSMARDSRSKLNKLPYKGYEFAGMVDDGFIFEESFWGVMLDLIYTGNEELAWQYLDLVWRNDKPGKELFRSDFKKQLAESPFWLMILEDEQ